ncbi:MAG: hypothetical protein HS107_13805 [Thermoflexaceae bacterium]|nr:hypothetical protein [Thermoflexaceae bacterium]
MPTNAGYIRKLSPEEVREGYIMILKDRLAYFPPPGATFSLHDGGELSEATIEAVDCECRGPERPHQHYRLHRPGLKSGDRVQVTKDGPGGAYRLEVVARAALGVRGANEEFPAPGSSAL